MDKKASNEDIIKMSPLIRELNLLSERITEVKRNREYTEEFEQEVREIVDSIHKHKILYPKGKLANRKIPKRMSHDWSDNRYEEEVFSDLHKILVRCEKIVLESMSEEIKIDRNLIKTTTTPKTTVDAGIFSDSTKNKSFQEGLRKPSKGVLDSKESLARSPKSEKRQNQKEVTKIETKSDKEKTYPVNLLFTKFDVTQEELIRLLLAFFVGFTSGIGLILALLAIFN